MFCARAVAYDTCQERVSNEIGTDNDSFTNEYGYFLHDIVHKMHIWIHAHPVKNSP